MQGGGTHGAPNGLNFTALQREEQRGRGDSTTKIQTVPNFCPSFGCLTPVMRPSMESAMTMAFEHRGTILPPTGPATLCPLIHADSGPRIKKKPSYCAAAPTPNSFSFEQMCSIGGPAEVGGCKGNRPKWDDAWHPLHRTRSGHEKQGNAATQFHQSES